MCVCIGGVVVKESTIFGFKVPAEVDKAQVLLYIDPVRSNKSFPGSADSIVDTYAAGLWYFVDGQYRLLAISGKQVADVFIDMIHKKSETTKS